MTSRRPQPAVSRSTNSNPALARPAWDGWGIVFLGLFLSRWFFPAEAADQGETLGITCLTLFAVAAHSWFLQRSGEGLLQLSRFDVAVAIFVGGHVLSTLLVLSLGGDRRAALNVGWEWLAVWGLYRHYLSRSPLNHRFAGVLSLVVTGTVLAAFGIWQHHVWYPALARAADQALSGNGRVGDDSLVAQIAAQLASMDSGGQQLFLSRLRNSTEPLGRFSLANTFAGILAVCGFLEAALAMEGGRTGRTRAAFWLIATGIIGYCFLLTKSRTAWVGVLLGLIYLGIRIWAGAPSQWRRRVLWTALGTVVLSFASIGLLVKAGSLDVQVFTEATKSLSYRLEYWQASLAVIKEHPFFGTGPGNFRQLYLQHKLPASSEEILDPHNLFLDVWVNGGLLALAGLLSICVMVLGRMVRVQVSSPVQASGKDGLPSVPAIATVAAIVLVPEWFLRGSTDLEGVVLLGGSLLLALGVDLSRRSRSAIGSVGTMWLAAAWLALSVHLLGAGGIGMAAVTLLWLWLASSTVWVLPSAQDTAAPASSSLGARFAPLAWAGLFLACLLTGWVPNLWGRLAVDDAAAAISGQTSLGSARRSLEATLHWDPFAPEPRQALAELTMLQWRRDDSQERQLFDEAIRWQQEAIARDPNAPKRYRVLGEFWRQGYQASRDPRDLQQAVDAYARAVQRYPHHALLQAEYAIALADAGADATAAARHALELHELNTRLGHSDKQLSKSIQERLEAILASR